MTRLAVTRHLLALLATSALLTACGSMPGAGSSSDSKPAAAPAPAKPAAAGRPQAGKIGPGMNAQGEVMNPKLVEAGYGERVKGVGDWEGEITGKPAPGSKFGQLKIGMSTQQVISAIGQPNDAGAHLTGKAFIPFYFGSDRARYEMVFKGQGRLLFATSAGFFGGGQAHLIWIIHSANEGDSR